MLKTLRLAALLLLAGLTPLRAEDAPAARTMLVLDASGSMWGQIDGENKIVIARQVIADLTATWPSDVHLGLTAYGHRKKSKCGDIEELVPVSNDGAAQISAVVEALNPKGKTPLSAAVQGAADQLADGEGTASILLITDGLETCKLDPCALGKNLAENNIGLKVHVVGFDLGDEDTSAIQCLATETGGTYTDASSAAELTEAVTQAANLVEQEAHADTIRVRLSDDEEAFTEKTTSFEYYPADDDGNIAGERITYEYATAGRPVLAPGQFVAQLEIGAVTRLFPFDVTEDEKVEHMATLDAGILTLNARLDEDSEEATKGLGWEVHELYGDGRMGERMTYGYGPNQIFYLPAGSYQISVVKGAAKARVEQVIEPGERTSLTIDLRAGDLAYSAVMSEGGAPIEAGSIGWEVHHADKDTYRIGDRATYAYGPDGAFTLSAGYYRLQGKLGAATRELFINVAPGETTPAVMNFNAGTLDHSAVLTPGGAAVSGSHAWEAYTVNGSGRPDRRLTYAYGEVGQFVLPAGPALIEIKAGAITRRVTVDVVAGDTISAAVNLDGGKLAVSGVNGSGSNASIFIYPVNPDGTRARYIAYEYKQAASFLVPTGTYDIEVKVGDGERTERVIVAAGDDKSVEVNME